MDSFYYGYVDTCIHNKIFIEQIKVRENLIIWQEVLTLFGSAGKEGKQDCVVNVNLRDNGGIEVKIKSKVNKLFDKQIERAATEAAYEMKVKNALIEVYDFNSLDFTIKARTKTAIKRAWRDVK